jgi:uncharacterized protein (DUF433 family)
MHRLADQLGKEENMTEIAPRIVVDPAVRFGRPVIRGTRVPVALVMCKLTPNWPVAWMPPR